jgi:hypothetical protein
MIGRQAARIDNTRKGKVDKLTSAVNDRLAHSAFFFVVFATFV